MIFTKEIWLKGKSSRGGWNSAQIRALGFDPKDLKRGWIQKIFGQDIDEQKIIEFLKLKDAHFKNKDDAWFNRRRNKGFPVFTFCPTNTPYCDQYLHPNWQKMRLYILKRDNFTCVNCKNQDEMLHVHHLKYKKDTFIWLVPHWYLVTLCEKCHSEEHGRDLTTKK